MGPIKPTLTEKDKIHLLKQRELVNLLIEHGIGMENANGDPFRPLARMRSDTGMVEQPKHHSSSNLLHEHISKNRREAARVFDNLSPLAVLNNFTTMPPSRQNSKKKLLHNGLGSGL